MKNEEEHANWIPSQFTKDEYIEVEAFWREHGLPFETAERSRGVLGEALAAEEAMHERRRRFTRPMRDALFLICAIILFGFLLKAINLAVERSAL